MTAMAVAGAAAGDGCFKKITSKEYIHLGPKHLGDVKAVRAPPCAKWAAQIPRLGPTLGYLSAVRGVASGVSNPRFGPGVLPHRAPPRAAFLCQCQGIKDHLAELIGSYIGSLGGVPVAHEDPRLEVGSGAISGDSP